MDRLTFCGTDGNAESCEPINCVDEYSNVARNICIDRLAAYEDTGLTPEKISAIQAENATLKKALEMMYQDNKGYNHDGTGNPEYYMQKARETDGQ